MATNNFNGIASNTGEDFLDELVSNIVYRESQTFVDKIKKDLDLKEDSYLDEAIESALTTLQYGLMNAVIITVTEYAIAKTSLILLGLVAYIKGSSLFNKTKSAIGRLFNKIPKKGNPAFMAVGMVSNVLIGDNSEKLAIAKMTNDSANNLVSTVSQERQNQILLRQQKLNRIDNAKSNLYGTRNKSRDKEMALFFWKTENGQWEKTNKDEKLYYNCVGRDNSTVNFNAEYVAKLNSLADVVKTAKGDIITRAKAEIDLITMATSQLKG